jgi:hypothetical protein
MRAIYHILGRFYEARATRALRAYFRLTERSEVFFSRLKGGDE